MEGSILREVSLVIPADKRNADSVWSLVGDLPGFDRQDPELSFLAAYPNLQFGWDAAKKMAQTHVRFPGTAFKEHYFWHAYLFCCDPVKYNSAPVRWAIGIEHAQNKKKKALIRAALVSSEQQRDIAKKLGVRPDYLAAYADLFFDIRSRSTDVATLVGLVYPDTRAVEQSDNYIEFEAIDKQLMRIAYNGGIDEMLYMAGLDNGVITSMLTSQNDKHMEQLLVAQAYFLAKHNYTRPSGSFQAAKGIINSAKQGGVDTAAVSPMGSMSEAGQKEIGKGLRGRGGVNVRQQQRAQKEDLEKA